MESNDSPEIPDRGETSDIPSCRHWNKSELVMHIIQKGKKKFIHIVNELHKTDVCM